MSESGSKKSETNRINASKKRGRIAIATPTPALIKHLNRGMTKKSLLICDLWNAGKTAAEISSMTETSKGNIYATLFRARQRGIKLLRKHAHIATARKLCTKQGKQLGSMYQLIDELPYDVAVWVVDSVPKGVTVAQYLISFIIDVYYEEVESKK